MAKALERLLRLWYVSEPSIAMVANLSRSYAEAKVTQPRCLCHVDPSSLHHVDPSICKTFWLLCAECRRMVSTRERKLEENNVRPEVCLPTDVVDRPLNKHLDTCCQPILKQKPESLRLHNGQSGRFMRLCISNMEARTLQCSTKHPVAFGRSRLVKLLPQ